jgi:hypothetical protein
MIFAPFWRASVAIAASSVSGMIVPVGLAGLAIRIPSGAISRETIAAAVSWKRAASPHGISTGTMFSARIVLR